jgi:hypothetical protein
MGTPMQMVVKRRGRSFQLLLELLALRTAMVHTRSRLDWTPVLNCQADRSIVSMDCINALSSLNADVESQKVNGCPATCNRVYCCDAWLQALLEATLVCADWHQWFHCFNWASVHESCQMLNANENRKTLSASVQIT